MLSLRDLNRATLARQLLLSRHEGTAADVLRAVAGLQAQEPRPPYLGMWSRLAGFDRADLHADLVGGRAVRATLWRGTLHLVTSDDFIAFRPLLQPLLSGAAMQRFPELEAGPVVEAALRLLAERPHTFNELRPRLQEIFPDTNERALGYAVRMMTPLVMQPTDDPWGFPRDAAFLPCPAPMTAGTPPSALVERYLAAFGPATVADLQSWSGLGGLKPVVEAMALVRLRGPDGRELFDLPDAPRPGGDVPAPVRFLPDFDTLILGLAERSRIVAEEFRGEITTKNLRVRATYLVDGFVAGTWQIKRTTKKATLLLTPFVPVDLALLEEEGLAALAFAEPDASSFALEVVS